MYNMVCKGTGIQSLSAWCTCRICHLKKHHFSCEALILERKGSKQAGNGFNQAWWDTTDTVHGFACMTPDIPELNGPDLGVGTGWVEAHLGS